MKLKFDMKNFFKLFLIIQPILDCYLLYSNKVINIFKFSPTTLIRLLVIGVYFIIIFLRTNRGKKAIIIYTSCLAIYIIIHHFICISFDESLIKTSFKYSTTEEIFYFLRMFLPVCMIYITYNLDFNRKEIEKIILFSALVTSLIVILLNISGLALTSYGSLRIKGTIFNWLDPSYKSIELASKGWFNSANQIGATIILLIILMSYYSLKNPNTNNFIVFVCLIITSMMLGTRTATIVVFYIVLFMFISYFIICFIKKNKINKNGIISYSLIIALMIFMYSISPIANCEGNNFECLILFDNGLDSSSVIETPNNLNYNGNTCDFIKETPTNPIYYKEIYPCNENVEFWTDFTKNKVYEYANNRTLEVLVTKDIHNKATDLKYTLFGISRSRFLDAKFYLEKDIYVHYYTIGIIGIILILIVPYIVPCIIFAIKSIKNKRIDTFEIILCFNIIMIFIVSYMSGHILDELIVTLYLGFIIGILLNDLYPKAKKTKSDRVLIVNDERMMGGVSVLLEDILNNIDKNIKIDLLILHNHGTRLKELPNNVNIIYGSPFFNIIDLNIKEVLKTKNIILIIKKIRLVLLIKTGLIKYKIELEREKLLKYDYKIEIAFKDGFCGLFTGFGNSEEKIQWLHSDYSKKDFSEKYRKLFIKLYDNFNKIIAVSKQVGENFNKIYGQKNKTIVINNLVDTNKIKQLSLKEKIQFDSNFNLISVGRLHIDKSFDRVIKCLSKLNNEGLLNDVKYRIIGDGYEYENLKNLIKENNLESIVELLGKKENPYPYVRSSDLFIMSSIHESFGLVIIESLLVNTPVLSTKLATINELLDDRYGMIVDNTENDLYNGIREILLNKQKIKDWKKNLEKYEYNNEKIIKSINDLLR